MGMFIVNKGAKSLVVRVGKIWSYKNLIDIVTKNDNVFDKSELVVDPTGISKVANGPGNVTIGSWYADRGYYAFQKDGWVLITHSNNVIYG